jgi:hypothetical protein
LFVQKRDDYRLRDDPVAPTARSDGARREDAGILTATGDTVHDMSSLSNDLANLTRNSICSSVGFAPRS